MSVSRLWWAAWLAYVCVLLLLALGPSMTPETVQHGDKILHGLAFLVLALGAPWTASGQGLWSVLAVVVLLGAGIEAAQYLVPRWGRSAEWLDFAADLAGGGLGLWVRTGAARAAARKAANDGKRRKRS